MLRHLHQIVLAATGHWATGMDIQNGAFAWVTGQAPLPEYLRRGPLELPRERGYRASTERHAELQRRIYLVFREYWHYLLQLHLYIQLYFYTSCYELFLVHKYSRSDF
jgi:hypothetical protein